MLRNRSTRKGFTLPEVLVTVAIVAVLAAAVVPTVVNQISKGDAASFSAEINAMTGAVTQFTTDTRQYPGELDHLNVAIATTDNDLMGSAYSDRAVASWKGPYLATTRNLQVDDFAFNSFGFVAANSLLAPSAQNGYHITLNLGPTTTLSLAALVAIDQSVDGGDGVAPTVVAGACATPTTASTSGRLQWTEDDDCVISDVRYRLVPVGS